MEASPSSVRSLSIGEEKVGGGAEKETEVTMRGVSLGERGSRESFFWMREVMKLGGSEVGWEGCFEICDIRLARR